MILVEPQCDTELDIPRNVGTNLAYGGTLSRTVRARGYYATFEDESNMAIEKRQCSIYSNLKGTRLRDQVAAPASFSFSNTV